MEYQIYESYDTFLLYQEFLEIPGDNRNDAHLFTGGVYECWTDGSAVLNIVSFILY